MGNRVKVPVEAIGTCRLILDTGYHLDLFQTFYVPLISRNLISLPKLDEAGYFFNSGNGCFSLLKQNVVVGSGTICDGLYKLKLDNPFPETLLIVHHNVGIKRGLSNESSAYLWHKHLGHISKERIQRLVKNEILPKLDFIDLGVCVDTKIIETGNARFIENGEVGGSVEPRKVEIQEVRVQVPLSLTSSQVVVPMHVDHANDIHEQHINDQTPFNDAITNEDVITETIINESQRVALRRSTRERRSAIPNEYVNKFYQDLRRSRGRNSILVSAGYRYDLVMDQEIDKTFLFVI
ncbi:hypothetical protein V2J09_018148 [Rumex salicifolius]